MRHRVCCPVQELAGLWEAVVEAMVSADLLRVADATLRYAYLWYNFMPLARGTAVVGYITLLGTFLAAGMPITSPAPKVINPFNVSAKWPCRANHYRLPASAVSVQQCHTILCPLLAC